MRAFFAFIFLSFSLFVLTGGSLALDYYKRHDLVVPRTVLADMDISGMSREEAREAVHARLTKFFSEPFQIAARGEAKTVTLPELGVSINESALLTKIPFAGEMSNAEVLLWSIAGMRVSPDAAVARPEIARIIDQKFPEIPKTRNAHFTLDGKALKIADAQKGVTPDVESLFSQVQKSIAFLEHAPLFVQFSEALPEISAQDLQQRKDQILKYFPKIITLTYDKKKWDVNFEKHPEWILFDRKPYAVAEGELDYSMAWDPVQFSNFIDENAAKELEQAPQDIRIWRGDNQKIQFEGHADDGRAIERERLLILANNAIANKKNQIEMPLTVVHPKIQVSDDFQALGIHDLLGAGYSRFEGSPENRSHNIGVGISKFNGILIPPGDIFSFDKNLGIVDDTTGYRKELVIKPEGTIPEFGGGICQVSTTMFRAALNSGLPIVARTPHSYAVRYYSQAGGHGLDATVYPPSPDLKFLNDTPSYILVQSYVDGPSASFKFYGTADGRIVSMDGPHISNQVGAPQDPVLVPDPKMQPGEKKQVEKPHGGFDALWYRYVTKNGETKKESIASHYKAMPAKFLVGGDVGSSTPGSLPPVNPFE